MMQIPICVRFYHRDADGNLLTGPQILAQSSTLKSIYGKDRLALEDAIATAANDWLEAHGYGCQGGLTVRV